jgi:carboxyl-terminal processing protease
VRLSTLNAYLVYMRSFIFLSLLLLNSALAEAKNATCRDAYALTLSGSNLHLNSPAVNQELIVKAANVYLDFKDPFKILLTSIEQEKIINSFSEKKQEALDKLKNNDCSSFDLIDQEIKKGEDRWKKLLTKSINDPQVSQANEVIRDGANLKWFKSETELENYSKYFTAQFIKIETSGKKQKTPKQIKDSFTKLYLTEKKPLQKEKDLRANLITRALFLAMDPHSDYISEEQASNFEMAVSANLQGVGLALKEDELGAKVNKIVKNGPADKSGKFKKNDIITKVDGKPIANLPINDVVDMIRGKKGTKVKIEVSRIDVKTKKVSNFEVTLNRDIIPLEEQRVKAEEINHNNKRVVVINIPSFYADPRTNRGTTFDVISSYQQLKSKGKIDLIILDLRNNGGGLLDESIRLSGIFMKEPVAVQVKSKEGVRHYQAAPAPVLINEPAIVLINRYSASASEIVAGALKDYHRALIVGDDRTYGKGTVQSVINKFRDFELGMIKVTSGKFYTPGGSSTQIKGVSSHVKIPSASQLQDLGEGNLKYALEWTAVDSALPKNLPKVLDKISSDLQSKSAARVEKSEEFKKFSSLTTYRKYVEEKNLEAEVEDDEDNRFNLKKDVILKEALEIGVDYLKVLPKQLSAK